MAHILGYARVSTGDQDVAGQTLRLEQASAIKLFTDVKLGKNMDQPGLADLLAYARPATRSPSSVSIVSAVHWRSCLQR